MGRRRREPFHRRCAVLLPRRAYTAQGGRVYVDDSPKGSCHPVVDSGLSVGGFVFAGWQCILAGNSTAQGEVVCTAGFWDVRGVKNILQLVIFHLGRHSASAGSVRGESKKVRTTPLPSKKAALW